MDSTLLTFIRAHTRVLAPPCVPEIHLHLADDPFRLWEKAEAEVGPGRVAPPYWAFAWAGGQAVGRYLLDSPALVAGRRVLDLASGSGLVAIAAAMAGATEVIANDTDPCAITALGLNAELNHVGLMPMDEDLLDGDAGDVDVILAGDVCYEEPMAHRVLPFLRRANQAGALVLVGDPARGYFPRSWFEALVAYEIPVARSLEGAEVKRTTVWRLPASRHHAMAGSR